jgi:hypothetical protein
MPNGRCYEGEWIKGKMHGTGKFIWEDGRVYQGGFNEASTFSIRDTGSAASFGPTDGSTKGSGSMIKGTARQSTTISTRNCFGSCGSMIR